MYNVVTRRIESILANNGILAQCSIEYPSNTSATVTCATPDKKSYTANIALAPSAGPTADARVAVAALLTQINAK